MDRRDETTTRRSFLITGAPCLVFGLRTLAHAQSVPETELLSETHLKECRRQLLEVINVERGLAGVPAVALDELACTVEHGHALDMARGHFLSHWGSDGLKPYQRYSLAGGHDYSAENVSGTDQIRSWKPDRVTAQLVSMNIRMHEEKPPGDGHRRTILNAEATHVGLGIALNSDNLRLAQLFLARYAEIEPLRRSVKTGVKFSVKGKLINRSHIFQQADVFFEPLPAPERSLENAGHRYSLPDEYKTLRPKLSEPMRYVDGSTGTIELGSHGKFEIPVSLPKNRPGIYTIVIWIKKTSKAKGVPITEICFKAI
jgi:uncharacterized protein YkwD